MKIKTNEEIKGFARQYNHKHRLIDIDGKLFDTSPLPESSFYDGYDQAQSDLLESASEGFDEYFSKYANESNLHHEFDAHKFWQACSLHHAKLIKEKDEQFKNEEECWLITVNIRDERIKELELKYQKAVTDIKWLLNGATSFKRDMRAYCKEVELKYGLDKQERKV